MGDDAIVQGIRDLARTTGVFAETAGGVTVAVLRQLVENGRLDPTKETVVLNTARASRRSTRSSRWSGRLTAWTCP